MDAASRVDAAPSSEPAARIGIAPGSDLPPAQPLTPAQTLPFVPAHQRDQGYASEVRGHPGLNTLEYSAQENYRAGPTGLGLLVCRVGTQKSVDKETLFWGRADLDLDIRIMGLLVKQHGPEDRDSALFTLPLMSLVGGEEVVVHLWDRDGVKSREDVGTVKATFAGKLPFTGAQNQNKLSCGHLPQALVETFVKETIGDADKEIGKLADDLKVVPGGQDLGLGWLTFVCQRRTSNIAALVGWGDPRIQRRLDWCQRLEQKLGAATLSYARVEEARAEAVTQVVLQTEKTTLEVGRPTRECKAGLVKRIRQHYGSTLPSWEERLEPCLLRFPVRNTGSEFFAYSAADSHISPTITLTTISRSARTQDSGLIGIDGEVSARYFHGLAPGAVGTLLFPGAATDGRLVTLKAESSRFEANAADAYLLIAAPGTPDSGR